MSIWYDFYNPDNGKWIDGGSYTEMPFFNKNVELYGLKRCAIKGGGIYNDITEWSTDEKSDLFQYYFQWGHDYWTEYITRKCALKMQKDMNINSTLFTDLMDKSGCNALIMDVSY